MTAKRITAKVFFDPGGHRLLREIVGMDDAGFATKWRAHVLGLHFD